MLNNATEVVLYVGINNAVCPPPRLLLNPAATDALPGQRRRKPVMKIYDVASQDVGQEAPAKLVFSPPEQQRVRNTRTDGASSPPAAHSVRCLHRVFCAFPSYRSAYADCITVLLCFADLTYSLTNTALAKLWTV